MYILYSSSLYVIDYYDTVLHVWLQNSEVLHTSE